MEYLFPGQQMTDRARGIVRRPLREQHARTLDEASLREGLRARGGRHEDNERRQKEKRPHCRRIACSVKSSSFSGTLYWRLSSVSRVRLPRVRSNISSCLAVQMPCTFWMSE